MRRHEIDRLGRDHLRGHRQVPFVFAIFVVDHHDHASGPQLADGIFNARERRLGKPHSAARVKIINEAVASQSLCRLSVFVFLRGVPYLDPPRGLRPSECNSG